MRRTAPGEPVNLLDYYSESDITAVMETASSAQALLILEQTGILDAPNKRRGDSPSYRELVTAAMDLVLGLEWKKRLPQPPLNGRIKP